MKTVHALTIDLGVIQAGLKFFIDSRRPDCIFDSEEESFYSYEARYQILEGHYYDFSFSDINFTIDEIGDQIVQRHTRNQHTGTLAPNIFVGTLALPVIRIGDKKTLTIIELEVQSTKTNYRDDYRDMLQFIGERCTDLILQSNSPVTHHFGLDYQKDSRSLYQKFSFVKSMVGSDEFFEAIHRIITAPVTCWVDTSVETDIRRVRRFSNACTKEFYKGKNRCMMHRSDGSINIKSLPRRVIGSRKTESIDSRENRFIKYVLNEFLDFCLQINNLSEENTLLKKESAVLVEKLGSVLDNALFKEVSSTYTSTFNSPVLQRKEGYREVMRIWLMFNLASKLIWVGGEDVYQGGKKDVATLYEYWLFFKLLEMFEVIFEIDAVEIGDLLKETPNGLNLQLKQGKFTALKGVYNSDHRKLNVKFSYNRSFNGKQAYPHSGSWTTTLRPDYTLSLWPFGLTESQAETEELIVHIQFDAKYKTTNSFDSLTDTPDFGLDPEKIQNRKGIFKNVDLWKMHTYKDAIRRTAGAYVLYPGSESKTRRGFHEIIPGLGAFSVRPSKIDDGIGELRAFITEVINHYTNKLSQREKLAFRTYSIHKENPSLDELLHDHTPELFGENRDLIPDEVTVLVGYYKSKDQYNWIKKKKMYNFRTGTGSGSLVLDNATVSARYLLLHTKGESSSGELWKIKSKGPRVLSKQDMLRIEYPSPSQPFYLVIDVEPVKDMELKDLKWEFKKLKNYLGNRASAFPFTTTLHELMLNKSHTRDIL